MKNNMNRILGLGAAFAGSAMLMSCDDGDSVFVKEDTGVADAINNAIGDKPVAPVALAEFPLTSLKLAFDNAAGACLGAAFGPGDELEIDFDAVSSTVSPANAQADLDALGGANGIFFGQGPTAPGFVEGISLVGAPTSWTIKGIYAGTSSSGSLLLGDLTLTPLASDQRSITGRFTASAPVDVAINQNTANVVEDSGDLAGLPFTIASPTGAALPVLKVTTYEDVVGDPAEVTNIDGGVVYEDDLGGSNYAVSVDIGGGCVLNFAISKADYDGFVPGGLLGPPADFQALLNALDVNSTLDVSSTTNLNEIPNPAPSPRYLIADTKEGGVSGSYRHDYDSTFGAPEGGINSSN